MRPNPCLLLALALPVTPGLAAQTPDNLPLVTELPASTRAMALGDAYVMNAGHADALFYHPALLTGASGFGIEMQRWGDASTSSAASAAMQWLGGGVGIGLLTAQYGAQAQGAGLGPGGQAHLFRLGSTAVSERVVVLGYARELFGIDFGVAGKLIEERADPDRETATHVDLGAATEVGDVTVALTVQDWGPDPVEGGGERAPRVVLGAGAYGRQVGIFDVGFSTAAEWTEEETTLSGGLEVGYWPVQGRTFVARLGLQDPIDSDEMSAFSFGLAFWGDDVTVEWAYRPYSGPEEPSGTHRFGLRWR